MKLKTKSKDYNNCIKQRKVKIKLNFYEQNIMLKIWQKNMTIYLNKNTIIQKSKQQYKKNNLSIVKINQIGLISNGDKHQKLLVEIERFVIGTPQRILKKYEKFDTYRP